jgi:hypothetical protein
MLLSMQMSSDAEGYMRGVAGAYVERGFPSRGAWWFDPVGEQPETVVHAELLALGLIERHGLKGNGFRLTKAGHDWVMENRSDL